MDTNQKPIPSAPPSEAPPYPQVPRENQLPLQGAATGQGSNSDPPPYQETFNYPQVPPYPVYAPTTTMPVQPSMPIQPPPQYVYPPAQAPQVIYTINQQAPPPPPPPPPPVSRSTNVTVVTSNATGVIRGGDPCPSCLGSYVNQVDSCCLVCLIILTICTFPFGLILIPFYFCTCRKRCNVCGRLK